MGDVTLEEFLGDENAWLRTIEISHKLWVKEIPASTIQALIREYDEKKELEIKNQQDENAKFNDSVGNESDGEDARSDIDHGEVSEDEEEEEIVVNVPMRPVSKRIRIPNSRYSSDLYVKI